MEHLDVEGDEAAAAALEKEAPSQLEKIIKNGYKGLGLEYFFTAGPDEVRVSSEKQKINNWLRLLQHINFHLSILGVGDQKRLKSSSSGRSHSH